MRPPAHGSGHHHGQDPVGRQRLENLCHLSKLKLYKLIQEEDVQVYGRFERIDPPDTTELAETTRNLSENLPEGWRWQGKTSKWLKHELLSEDGYGVYTRSAVHVTIGEVALVCRRREESN